MCINCDEIIQVGNSGTDGWSPILALYEGECDGDAVTVHQLISWDGGSGNRPSYSGNIMTDQWLIDHPIYLGSDGFVTDICEATPLNGGSGNAGTPGGTGPEGPAGPAGCAPIADLNFEFTNNGELLEPPVDFEVVIDDTEPCNPIYDVSIDALNLFTNDGLITALLDTPTFQTYIDNIVATSIGGVNGLTTLGVSDIAKTGNPLVFYTDAMTLTTPVANLSFVGTDNFIKHNILGNRMTIDFLFNIETTASNNVDILLQLQIPAGKTVYNVSGEVYPESNAVAVTIPSEFLQNDYIFSYEESLQGTPVITTYQAPKGSNYLSLGVTPNAYSVTSDVLYGFNFRTADYAYRIQGQLTFTINT
jgi:hypothetical protein